MENISEVIHNKKVAKKKQISDSHMPSSQIAHSIHPDRASVAHAVKQELPLLSAVEHTTTQPASNSSIKQKADRTRTQRINAEIDAYIYELVCEGLVMIEFKAYLAKCIRTLGLPKVQYIVFDVRQAGSKYHRGKLLSYKLKGEMTLHFKRLYEADALNTQQR